jgi:GLPGLI family protein
MKITITLALFLIVGQLNAQMNFTIIYGEGYSVGSGNNDSIVGLYERKHIVYTNGDSLAFCSFSMQKPSKKINTVGSKRDHHAGFIFSKLSRVLHENYWTKPFGLIEQSVKPDKWQILSDTLRIEGYLCRAAVSDSKIAWFAEDVPLPFGPFLNHGLPGLILMLQNKKTFNTFKAISIVRHAPRIVLPNLPIKPCKDCDSKRNELEKYFER